MNLRKFFFVLPIITYFFGGCVYTKIEKQLKELKVSTYLHGNIISHSAKKKRIVIIVYLEQFPKKEIIDYKVLHEPGQYLFVVPEGEYYILAFEDSNDNLIYDKDEFAGVYGSPDKITGLSAQINKDLDIIISEAGHIPPDFPVDLRSYELKGEQYRFGGGAIVNLDDETFSSAYASKGLWEPETFLKEVGGGVFFLEKYDKNKIPILFVHGSRGTPRTWTFFINNIDRYRYQPWVFYYPSALRLEKLGMWLNGEIKRLHDKYQFRQLYVTAHSMGGLVARSFIIQNIVEDSEDYIKLFVSISTPWGGIKLAEFGLEYAPSVIPAWEDLAPESEFLQSIFEKELPSKVRYYLFFGYKGIGIPFMSNNDGSVTLESALYLRSQEQAIKIYGFNEHHVSILTSYEVLKKYNEILISTKP